jgi:hypothetical protein
LRGACREGRLSCDTAPIDQFQFSIRLKVLGEPPENVYAIVDVSQRKVALVTEPPAEKTSHVVMVAAQRSGAPPLTLASANLTQFWTWTGRAGQALFEAVARIYSARSLGVRLLPRQTPLPLLLTMGVVPTVSGDAMYFPGLFRTSDCLAIHL